MLKVIDLRVEYKKNPIGMDEKRPRFFYRLNGSSIAQRAYRIVVSDESGAIVWDTDFVESPRTIQIEYKGLPLKAFTRYDWKVRVRDEKGKLSEWSREEAFFETGFLDTAWTGKWISEQIVFNGGHLPEQPAQRLCRDFTPSGKVRKARYYATALGVYESAINGEKVSEDCLAPGYTDFYNRTQYQAYDVTKLIRRGENRIATLLAEGWYCGRIARNWAGGNGTYGEFPAFKAELRLEYEDGRIEIIGTDEKYVCRKGTQAGINSIVMSDIYMGETFRSEQYGDDWMLPGFNQCCGAESAAVVNHPNVNNIRVEWQSGVPVRRIAELKPVSVTQRKNGNWIVDFGQNFAGRERIRMKNVIAGTCIVIRHGEMLKKDGSLYTANLRSAACTTTYICDADKKSDVYEPRFTFYGFRYVEISGWPGILEPGQITGEVLSSDLPSAGSFSCSDPLINRLFSNIVWGQLSNFVDIPTDCPQRDERQGWTGDTQVFANVATYNAFAPEFYTKWIEDLNLCQAPNGSYPHIAPNPYRGKWVDIIGCSGWSDAGVICPDVMFRKYADTRILGKYFDRMCAWLDFQIKHAGGSLIVSNACYGDWLNIDAPTPPELISTAYLAGMNRLVSKFAFILGREADGEYRANLAEAIAEAFGRKFFDKKGNLTVKTQTAALLALHFELVPDEAFQKTVDFLVRDIRKTRGTHLSTGFLGTPLLLKVLTETGNIDLAYDLLRQTTYPGWLYPVTQGATTMWERWNSYNHETGFGDIGMNSFNHYAYGAVGEWFYETICGIQPDDCCEDCAGFQAFTLAPKIGNALTEASASVMTLHGEIKSAWKREGKTVTWNFTVPCNTLAVIEYPTEKKVPEVKGIEADESGILIAEPGSYSVKFSV